MSQEMRIESLYHDHAGRLRRRVTTFLETFEVLFQYYIKRQLDALDCSPMASAAPATTEGK